jgi:peptidoglycan/LPS O-acetylase OafA/YrhL
MVSILCGGLLLTAIQPAGARWPALLHARSLRLIGKYSYGIYVIHNLLMPWFYDHFLRKSWLIRPVPGIAATLIYLVLSFLCSLAAAYISWHLFEKKFLSLKRFFPSREQTLTTGITGNRTLTNF